MDYKRPIYNKLLERITAKRQFIQVLSGPRQVGKTTLAHQLIAGLAFPSHYATADEPAIKGAAWIEQQWGAARSLLGEDKSKALLVLDEVQKIPDWSETVKRLWDKDSAEELQLQVLLLGSSALLVQKGLSESLAGRFEIIPISHWSYPEMQEAFDWSIDQYIFFGGYPGTANLINDPERWASYIRDSLIEPTLSRDILLMTRVDKPALLRQLFELGCSYSGQILSYNKMLGQLQDAGNTTTLAHYLELLDGAGLVTGLQKFSRGKVRHRASSPKLLALNTALMSAPLQTNLEETKNDGEIWGRLVETAVGSSLVNSLKGKPSDIYYWRSRNKEVDFVLAKDKRLVAIEVKSGVGRANTAGMEDFIKEYPSAKPLLVGAGGIPLETFFASSAESLLD